MYTTLTCFSCKINFQRRTKAVNAARYLGRQHAFCTPKCLHDYQSKTFAKAKLPSIKQYISKVPDGQKKCGRCKLIKPITEFGSKTNGHFAYCRPCHRTYQQIRWFKRKIKAIYYLGGKCKNCGYNAHWASFDFHHRDPSQKSFSWDKLKLRTWKTIITELDKCDLLCANCHRIHHTAAASNPELWQEFIS